MDITVSQIITWVVVGGIVGSFIGMIFKGDKKGYGTWKNFGIGLVGALIGGVLFNLFKILPDLDSVSISARDLVAAAVGCLIFLGIMAIYRKTKKKPTQAA